MLKIGIVPGVQNAESLSWRLIGCEMAFAGWLLAIQLWLALLWFYYQGFGAVRGLILAGLLIGLIALRFLPARSARYAGLIRLPPVLRGLLIAALLLDVGMMVVSGMTSLHKSKIPMDEGQTSWRAARLLWRGEDPYAKGALVDFGAFRSRVQLRGASGIDTPVTGHALSATLARYDASLDPSVRGKLFPVSSNSNETATREAHLYGYKYGPVILVAVALVAPFGIPAAVLFLNGLVCFGLYFVNWRILRRIAWPQLALAGAAILALLLDRHITRNYIDRSATDVWALLFGSLAVLAVITRRPLACAAGVAFAIGCKSIPGLLFAPLLLRFRSPVPPLVCIVLTGVLYLPWLLWDSSGVLYNVFLWPFYMTTDFTAWQYFAPPWATLFARIMILGLLIVLWTRYLTGRESRLFWTLAISSTLVLLAGGFLRNGYVPWASLWAVAAVVEAFTTGGGAPSRENSVPTVSTQMHRRRAEALALARTRA
jgi:hypothetical protein